MLKIFRLLIVEDERLVSAVIAETCETRIKNRGVVEIDRVYECDAALKLLDETSDYDVAILDVTLGDKAEGGFECLEKCLSKNIPCVMLTGHIDADMHRRAMNLAYTKNIVCSFVTKPFNSEHLIAALEFVVTANKVKR